MSTIERQAAYKPADYKSDIKAIWCPGCGDYHVLMSFTRAFAQLGLPPEQIVVVSGLLMRIATSACTTRPSA